MSPTSTLDLGQMRKQVSDRVSEITSELDALQREHADLQRLLDSMPGNGTGPASTKTAARKRKPSAKRQTAKKAAAEEAAAAVASAAGETGADAKPAAKPKAARSRKPRAKRKPRAATSRTLEEMTNRLVSLLEGGPKPRTELAESLGVSQSRVQQLLQPLLDAGRVSSERDADNPRRNLWRLQAA